MTSSSLEVVRYVQLATLVPINLIGNILVVMVVFRTKKTLRTPMNHLLVNLAVADIMVAFFMVVDQFFFHVVHHPEGVAGDLLCKTLTGKIFTWVGSIASVYTLLAIACERFYAIVLPHHGRGKMTKKKLHLIIVFCWLFALFLNVPLFVVRKHNHAQAETGFFCRSYWPINHEELPIGYSYLWVLLVGVIPVSLMTYFYGRVVHNLWFSQRHVVDEAQKARLNNRKRVTKMLLILTVIFAVCWFPNLLINVISYYVSSQGLLSIGYLVSEMLVLLNSTINPFVYAIQSKHFRESIKTIVCCRQGRNRVMPLVTGSLPPATVTPATEHF